MLGNIAKKLRLMSFDTLYSSNISDKKILSTLKSENRILITKDKLLSKLAEKEKLQVIYLNRNDEFSQFYLIKKQLGLEKLSIDVHTSRCTLCNGKLEKISKSLIHNRIPSRILEFRDSFWQCSKCSKVYWEGTHIINLQNFIGRLNEKS